MQLLIGSNNTSSWSMRTWIVRREKDIPFEEINVPMRAPDCSARRLRALLPAGKVPCLTDRDVTVWETLAIFEHCRSSFQRRHSGPLTGTHERTPALLVTTTPAGKTPRAFRKSPDVKLMFVLLRKLLDRVYSAAAREAMS